MQLAGVAVINLARRSDRLSAVTHRMWQVPDFHTLQVIAFAASEDPDNPDRGCLLSHIRALSCVRGPALVLEDDACFAPGFTLDIDPPDDWDVLWLGGQHRLAPRPHDATWVVPRHFVRTHAYIAREPARVAQLLHNVPRIDPYMAALPLHQYVLKQHTVGQSAGRSDISGVIRPVDEYWQLRYRPGFHSR